jgi:signal transduction histidine kinase
LSQTTGAVGFEELFESADEAILVVELATHRIQRSNAKAVQLFGDDVQQPGSLSLEQLFPLIPLEQLRDLVRSQDRDSIREVIEVRWTEPRNRERWFELRGISASFRGRNMLLVHARDVPERQHLASGIAHELNNLLQGMRMCSNVLAEEVAMESGFQDLVKHIDSSIEKARCLMQRLVDHCLDLEQLTQIGRLHSSSPCLAGDVAQPQALPDR